MCLAIYVSTVEITMRGDIRPFNLPCTFNFCLLVKIMKESFIEDPRASCCAEDRGSSQCRPYLTLGACCCTQEDKAWVGKGRVWAPLLSAGISEKGASQVSASVCPQGPVARLGTQ